MVQNLNVQGHVPNTNFPTSWLSDKSAFSLSRNIRFAKILVENTRGNILTKNKCHYGMLHSRAKLLLMDKVPSHAKELDEYTALANSNACHINT